MSQKLTVVFAENVHLLDEKTKTFPPEILDEAELVPHNVLLAQMFNFLTGCQAIQQLQIYHTKNSALRNEIMILEVLQAQEQYMKTLLSPRFCTVSFKCIR
jgi:hypothetical protein